MLAEFNIGARSHHEQRLPGEVLRQTWRWTEAIRDDQGER
jgi:hypothetical protein